MVDVISCVSNRILWPYTSRYFTWLDAPFLRAEERHGSKCLWIRLSARYSFILSFILVRSWWTQSLSRERWKQGGNPARMGCQSTTEHHVLIHASRQFIITSSPIHMALWGGKEPENLQDTHMDMGEHAKLYSNPRSGLNLGILELQGCTIVASYHLLPNVVYVQCKYTVWWFWRLRRLGH